MLTYEYCRMLNRLRIHHGETEILFMTGVSKEQAETIFRGLKKLEQELSTHKDAAQERQ